MARFCAIWNLWSHPCGHTAYSNSCEENGLLICFASRMLAHFFFELQSTLKYRFQVNSLFKQHHQSYFSTNARIFLMGKNGWLMMTMHSLLLGLNFFKFAKISSDFCQLEKMLAMSFNFLCLRLASTFVFDVIRS